MNPDRWNLLQSLFEQTLQKEPKERRKFLDTACGGDTDLIEEVLELVDNFTPASQFFLSLEQELHQAFVPNKDQPLPQGTEIGEYRIIRELGRGGMARVYLADRISGDFQQKVAIKVMKLSNKTSSLLPRFEHERQILANLKHPYIAQLYGGGDLSGGLPYFIMEYIEGEALDTYVDRNSLSIEARVSLFLKIAEAVQYAHQNLIIHRDLKPNNIWIERDETPKLLDFGIAKLMEPDPYGTSIDTQAHIRLLTPEYASPEQVEGESVSTATDIYQLGLLLYEMLSGSRPFDFTGLAEKKREQLIRTQIPKAPSARFTELVGQSSQAKDLDAITLKCLRKQPEERYTSVGELIQDLRSVLTNQPISIRGSEWTYRTRKFVQRNRAGVIAATLALVFLVGGIVTTSREAIRANRALASEREARLQESTVSTFLKDLLELRDPNGLYNPEIGQFRSSRRALENMLDQTLVKIRKEFSQQPDYRVELMAIIADFYAKLERPKKATEAYKEVISICDTTHTCGEIERIYYLRMWATQQLDLGDYKIVDSTLTLCMEQLEKPIKDPAYIPEKALTMADRAKLFTQTGRLQLSDSLFTQAFELFGQQEEGAFEDYYEFALPHLTLSWSRCKKKLGQYNVAIDLAREAYTKKVAYYGEGHPVLGEYLYEIGSNFLYIRQTDSVIKYMEKTLSLYDSTEVNNTVVASMNDLGYALGMQKRYEEQERAFVRLLAIKRQLYGDEHEYNASTLLGLGQAYSYQGKLNKAEETYLAALRINEAELPVGHQNTAACKLALARLYLDQGKYTKGLSTIESTLEEMEGKLPPNHQLFGFAFMFQGKCFRALQRNLAARTALKKSLEIFKALNITNYVTEVQEELDALP